MAAITGGVISTRAADELPAPVVAADCAALSLEPLTGNPRVPLLNQRAEAGGFDVMMIGDSITQGWETSPGGQPAWKKFLDPYKAANFGVSGDRTGHVLWRLENGNLKGTLDPKVIVLMIGTNNTGHKMDKPDEIAAGIAAIIRTLHRRFPKARIILHAIFPRGALPDDPKRKNNEAANKLIAKYDGHLNVRYVNINKLFLDPHGELKKEIAPDLLHLSKKGYDIWGQALAKEISRELKEDGEPHP